MASFKRTAWIKESRCPFVRPRKVSKVSSSAPKLWIIRIPDKSSWTKALRLEDFFLWICHLLWERVWIYQIQAAISGRLIKEAAASPAFLINIIATTAQMVMKSGIRAVSYTHLHPFIVHFWDSSGFGLFIHPLCLGKRKLESRYDAACGRRTGYCSGCQLRPGFYLSLIHISCVKPSAT